MTNASDMYGAVLIELDSFGSPAFDVADFNYWINKAVERLVKEELRIWELTQEVTDKLSPLVKESDPIVYSPDGNTDIRSKELPEDYRHVVSVLVKLRYRVASVVYAVGDFRKTYTKRMTGDGKAYVDDNAYFKPMVKDHTVRLYHRVVGPNLVIYLDSVNKPESSVNIADVVLEYISQPPQIELDEDDYTTVVHDTVFREHFNREIVAECAKLFLENGDSPRLLTQAEVNK